MPGNTRIDKLRAEAITYATRFRWGFENAVFGSDDWRCDAINPMIGLDDNDDPMAFDDGPCDCPECAGASARRWNKTGKLPLSIRVSLNLAASSQPVQGK